MLDEYDHPHESPLLPAEQHQANPNQTYTLTGHTSSINCVRFNQETGIIASGDANGGVFFWDINQPLNDVNISNTTYHKNEVLDLIWLSPDHLLTASADQTAKIYDFETNTPIHTVSHKIGSINSVCASTQANPQLFATAGDNGEVLVWDPRFADPVHEIATSYPICAVQCDPAMNTIFSGGVNDTISVFDLVKGSVSMQLRGHTNTITSLHLSEDNSLLASYSVDESIRVWDVRPTVSEQRQKSGRLAAMFRDGPRHNFRAQQLHRARLITNPFSGVVATSLDGGCYLWRFGAKPGNDGPAVLKNHTGPVHDVDCYKNWFASCGADKTICVGALFG